MSRRTAYAVVAAATIVPRLGVLLRERDTIVVAFTEKSDRFAEVFLHHGTYGLVPGEPSAYTQPLYGWFLIVVYWIFGRSWESVGLAQIVVATGTAWLVFEIGRRFLSQRAAVVAALLATLNPYLVWHDVHVNREILDQLVAAAVVLVTLLAVERRSLRLAALDGLLCGIAMLGNTRLALLPILVAGYLVWRLRTWIPAVAVIVLAAVAVMPWLVRNKVNVGCWTLTTDARAVWKANNPRTYKLLTTGRWIDAVRPLPGAPPTPELAADIYERDGRIVPVDECAQMALYQHQVIEFWKHHPGEKAKLAQLAVRLEWDPRVHETSTSPGAGTWLDKVRSWAEGGYMSVLYTLGIAGLFLVPRALAMLVVLLLAYNTLAAVVFAGTTRYRAPWDFLIALLAATTLAWLAERRARPARATE